MTRISSSKGEMLDKKAGSIANKTQSFEKEENTNEC